MDRLRSFYDSDRAEGFFRPTENRTDVNKYEMFCGNCGDKLYVDKDLFRRINNAIEEGTDNPLMCEDCENSYEELGHPAG